MSDDPRARDAHAKAAVLAEALPWAALQLDPDGQSAGGALSGIVIRPGVGLYVTNESGQTADAKSVYGAVDGASGWFGDTFYTDLFADDNDPILGLQIPAPGAPALQMPEPGALALLLTGLLLLAAGRRRIAGTRATLAI